MFHRKTHEEMYKWLAYWLIPCSDEPFVCQGDNHHYQMIAYFQIAFHMYCVFYDLTTQEYVWHISENYVLYDDRLVHSPRYSFYEALLQDVSYKLSQYLNRA